MLINYEFIHDTVMKKAPQPRFPFSRSPVSLPAKMLAVNRLDLSYASKRALPQLELK